MYCVKNVTEDLYWVGASDRRLALFENIYPIPKGVSYNSYVLLDEKTVLLDTVDKAVSGQFFENLEHVLSGRNLDYVIINHMEPDHCATLGEVVLRYPNVKIVGNAKTFAMIKQFFSFDVDSRAVVIKEGDTLNTGKHTLAFAMIPMVHWPEAMVTYDAYDKVLFSADAFGTFGALNGNLFADEVNFEEEWLAEARRYLTNIVGKYGTQVQAALKKASALDIAVICPLHGPVWRENLGWFIEKYQKWSTYTPEDHAVLILYASIYGNTENAVNVLAGKLGDKGEKNIAVYDVSVTDPSYLLAEAFRCDRIVFASPTYNAGIFPKMETLLTELKAHNLQNRKVAVMENGTWAVSAGKQMKEILSQMKNMEIYEDTLTVKSALKQDQMEAIDGIVEFLTK
ncbi:MAG TPA: FprA family A-type flavoprotein [Candidatus Blautia faecavium]|uniref:FprA family A-type flavoprotein n=1 Tax=Candidatus Blautia faecavium TaxID=2838487 RepID=A0A9D2RVD9_9FIRM|nr:FprA family A-type flavoprotein [Candidatus Blautia faecavium]